MGFFGEGEQSEEPNTERGRKFLEVTYSCAFSEYVWKISSVELNPKLLIKNRRQKFNLFATFFIVVCA